MNSWRLMAVLVRVSPGFTPTLRPSMMVTTPAEREGNKPENSFELNKGRAIDTLKADFHSFWEQPLSWDIYTSDVEIIDPSGFQLRGVTSYKAALAAIRTFRNLACDDVDLTRLVFAYDSPRKVIEAKFHTKWHLKGFQEPTYISGVSHFFLDDDGLVEKHLITRFLVDGRGLGVRASLAEGFRNVVGASACPQCGNFKRSDFSLKGADDDDSFRTPLDPSLLEKKSSSNNGVAVVPYAPPVIFQTASEVNKPEKKAKKVAEKKEKGGFMSKCEYMWDCEYPLECCDLIVGKACCGGGEGIPAFLRGLPQSPKPVPIPVPVEAFPGESR